MTASNPGRSRWNRVAYVIAAALVLLAAPSVRAQRPAAAARPAYRTYQRPVMPQQMARPTVSRPVLPPRQMVYPQPVPVQPMPIQRPVVSSLPRALPPRTFVAPAPVAPRPFAPRTFVQPALPPATFYMPAFQPRSAWRGIGPRVYDGSLFFFGTLVPSYGYWQVPSNYQMLPLGFGLWPACDSAAIPGRFWTVGPCAGLGDYQSLAPSYQNEYLMGNAPYYQPFVILQQPQAAPASSAEQPSAPEPNMVICLTDGRQLEVSDWWVTEGRFFFILVNGKTQSINLDTLDLKKTIETDEARGRTFMLNFTPPDQRPVLPPLPSNR